MGRGGASLEAQLVKNPSAMWETWVWSLGWEDTLEKGMATDSIYCANGWSKCHKMNHVGFKALYISCLGTKSFTGIGHTEHSGSSRYPFKWRSEKKADHWHCPFRRSSSKWNRTWGGLQSELQDKVQPVCVWWKHLTVHADDSSSSYSSSSSRPSWNITGLQRGVASSCTAWRFNSTSGHDRQGDHPDTPSYRLPLCKVAGVALTLFPMPHTLMGLIYFVTAGCCLLISLACFTHPPTPLPSGNHLFLLSTCEFVSVLFCWLVCFAF